MIRFVKNILIANVIASFLILVPSASIASPVWTHVGAACTPDEASADRFESAAARFRHVGSNTGAIVARCNVINPTDTGANPVWNYLEVVYFDPPGENQVTAELVRVSNSTGGVWTVATFDSNAPDLTPNEDAQTNGIFFRHVFDFNAYAYYITITVRRTEATAANNPAVSIVRLTQTIE
jgi:hypothetical protein